jgi:hypothetical protein
MATASGSRAGKTSSNGFKLVGRDSWIRYTAIDPPGRARGASTLGRQPNAS